MSQLWNLWLYLYHSYWFYYYKLPSLKNKIFLLKCKITSLSVAPTQHHISMQWKFRISFIYQREKLIYIPKLKPVLSILINIHWGPNINKPFEKCDRRIIHTLSTLRWACFWFRVLESEITLRFAASYIEEANFSVLISKLSISFLLGKCLLQCGGLAAELTLSLQLFTLVMV